MGFLTAANNQFLKNQPAKQMKETKMKTNKIVTKTILGLGVTFALAMSASLRAEEPMKPMKGGEHQMMLLNGVNTTQEVDALKTDDSIAMVCAKCKTVWVTRVKQDAKGAQILMEGGKTTNLIGTHACAGCNSTLTVTGHAKGDITELKHSCKMCGDDSAFCCATTKGGKATNGMKKM
jgi:hypothetical protein